MSVLRRLMCNKYSCNNKRSNRHITLQARLLTFSIYRMDQVKKSRKSLQQVIFQIKLSLLQMQVKTDSQSLPRSSSANSSNQSPPPSNCNNNVNQNLWLSQWVPAPLRHPNSLSQLLPSHKNQLLNLRNHNKFRSNSQQVSKNNLSRPRLQLSLPSSLPISRRTLP